MWLWDAHGAGGAPSWDPVLGLHNKCLIWARQLSLVSESGCYKYPRLGQTCAILYQCLSRERVRTDSFWWLTADLAALRSTDLLEGCWGRQAVLHGPGEQGRLCFVRSRWCCGLSGAEIISEPNFVLALSCSVAIWRFLRCWAQPFTCYRKN